MPMTDQFVAQLDYCLRTELPRDPPDMLNKRRNPPNPPHTDTDCIIIPLNQVPVPSQSSPTKIVPIEKESLRGGPFLHLLILTRRSQNHLSLSRRQTPAHHPNNVVW